MRKSVASATSKSSFSFLLLIYVAMIWPKYAGFSVFGVGINPYSVIVMTSIVILGFNTIKAGGLQRRNISIAIIVFWLLWLCRYTSDFLGDNPASSFYLTTRELIFVGSLFVLGHSVRLSISDEKIAAAFQYAIIVLCLIGIFEFVTQTSFPNYLVPWVAGNIDAAFLRVLTASKERDGLFRSQAVFIHPIVYGQIAAAIVPICVAQLVQRKRTTLGAIALFSSLLAIFLSGSRSSIIALIGGVAILGAIYAIRIRYILMKAVLVVMLPIFYGIAYWGYNVVMELASGRSAAEIESSQVRMGMWDRGWNSITESLMWGYGDGQSVIRAGVASSRNMILTIDDYFLTVLLDFGFIGFVLMCLFIGASGGKVIFANDRKIGTFDVAYFCSVVTIFTAQRATSISEGMGFLFLLCGLLSRTRLGETVIPPANNGLQK